VGLATIFFMEDDRPAGQAEFSGRLTDLRRVAANPDIWLIAAIIFSAYFSFRIQDIMTPYSTNVCGLSAALGATVASIRTYVMGGGAVLGGLAGDRLGPANTMIIGFMTIILTNLIFLLIPGNPATLAIFLSALMPFMVAHFMMRGVYYALLTEGRVPLETTGLATGIIATVAYTPDVFSPLYQGFFLDHFGRAEQAGYTYIFLSSLLSCLAGLFFCYLFKRRLGKANRQAPAPLTAKLQP